MNAENLAEQFAALSDNELDSVVNERFDDYTEQALELARAEAERRNIRVQPRVTPRSIVLAEVRTLPSTHIMTVVLLQTLTLGLYLIYWMGRNWTILQKSYGERISPFWRTIFAPLFIHDLFREVRRNSRKVDATGALSPVVLTILFWSANIAGLIAIEARSFVGLLVTQLLFLASIGPAQAEINRTVSAARSSLTSPPTAAVSAAALGEAQ